MVSLRVAATRNNQSAGVRMAADYEISRWSLARLEAAADWRTISFRSLAA
jgi:hypothetical protein